MTRTRTLILSCMLGGVGLNAQNGGSVNDTARLLAELIRINTSNPPGNEAQLAAFLKSRFGPLGFQIDIVSTPDPAKAHFIARMKGDGSKRPILRVDSQDGSISHSPFSHLRAAA